MKLGPTASSLYQVPPAEARAFLQRLLELQAKPQSLGWLEQQLQKIAEDQRKFILAFSMASRYFENKTNSNHLALKPGLPAEAESLRPGFSPQYWSALQIARTLLLLALEGQAEDQFTASLEQLAETADVAEQTALYAALPLLPHPHSLTKRTAEGLRTNIVPVFDAIALHNPYPADYLEEAAWNQLLLKAVFLNRPLYQIWGAERRQNATLAQMLLHFAHERWAANRSVSPEIWRFVGPHLTAESFAELERLSREGTALEKEAVLLACAQSHFPAAARLLAQQPQQQAQIKAGTISWQTIGQRYHQA